MSAHTDWLIAACLSNLGDALIELIVLPMKIYHAHTPTKSNTDKLTQAPEVNGNFVSCFR